MKRNTDLDARIDSLVAAMFVFPDTVEKALDDAIQDHRKQAEAGPYYKQILEGHGNALVTLDAACIEEAILKLNDPSIRTWLNMYTGEQLPLFAYPGWYFVTYVEALDARLTEIVYTSLPEICGISHAEIEELVEYDDRHEGKIAEAIISVIGDILADAERAAEEPMDATVSVGEVREYLEGFSEYGEVTITDGRENLSLQLGFNASWPVDWTTVGDLRALLDEMGVDETVTFRSGDCGYCVIGLGKFGPEPKLVVKTV